MFTASRRTILVLASLTAAMTLTSLLLLILEPNGRGLGSLNVTPLLVTVGNGQRVALVDATDVEVRPENWSSIEIALSYTPGGSIETISRMHRDEGLTALGDHFVITNGPPVGDGGVVSTFRWKDQSSAVRWVDGRSQSRGPTVTILVVGDTDTRRLTDAQMNTLIQLVRDLQVRLHIPPEMVSAVGQMEYLLGGNFRDRLLYAAR